MDPIRLPQAPYPLASDSQTTCYLLWLKIRVLIRAALTYPWSLNPSPAQEVEEDHRGPSRARASHRLAQPWLLIHVSRLNFGIRSDTTNLIVANAREQVERADGKDDSLKSAPKCDLHHAHLFASDLQASIRFYREMFGAEIVLDNEVAGARNVLLRLGSAYINFYDQPPRDTGRGVVHHLGIRTNDIAGLVAHMKSKGFEFRKEITDLGPLKYVMAAGPDGILLELFETDLF